MSVKILSKEDWNESVVQAGAAHWQKCEVCISLEEKYDDFMWLSKDSHVEFRSLPLKITAFHFCRYNQAKIYVEKKHDQ